MRKPIRWSSSERTARRRASGRRLLLKIFFDVYCITDDKELRLSFKSIYVVTFRLEKRQKAFLSRQMNRPYGNERATPP